MQQPRIRLAAPAMLALLALAALGGCGRVEATVRTQEALRAAGLQGPVVSVQERGGETTVQVRYNSRAADGAGLRAEQDAAARVVWANATVPLDVIKVTPDDNAALPAAETRVYSRDDLSSRFGARPGELDRPPAAGGPRAIGYGLVAAATGLAILAAAGTLALVLVQAKLRRRRAVAAATAWPAPGPADPGAPANAGGVGLGPPAPHPPGPGPDGRGGRPRAPAPGRPAPSPGPGTRGAGQAPGAAPPPGRGLRPPPGSWPAPPDA